MKLTVALSILIALASSLPNAQGHPPPQGRPSIKSHVKDQELAAQRRNSLQIAARAQRREDALAKRRQELNDRADLLSSRRIFTKASNLFQFTFTWENTKNVRYYREDPEERLTMQMVETDRSSVDVIAFRKNIDKRILNKFVDGSKIFWPQHPLNQSSVVPFFGATTSGKSIQVGHTASRSLLSLAEDAPPFSIKAGTDYPHSRVFQEHKADTTEDIEGSMLAQPFINQMTDILPPGNILGLLPEVLILRDRKTQNGVLIRDLSAINNDNIYITGLSIPYVGRQIAMKNGVPFEEFWLKTYAEQLGRAKAHFLMDYGMEMKTPNAQNILVELTKDSVPTGRIFFRDIGGDSNMYRPWLKALQLENVIAQHHVLGFGPLTQLRPDGHDSLWRFDEAEEYSFSSSAMENMQFAHDEGWISEMRKLLKFTFECPHFGNNDAQNFKVIDDFLKTPSGADAIIEYHKSIGTFDKLEEVNQETYRENFLL